MRWLKHAFAIEPPGPAVCTPEQQRLVDRFAYEAVRRGVGTPALLFLECSHPLNFVASQALVFFGPVARLIFDPASYDRFAAFLEQRGSVETLCRRIEDVIELGPESFRAQSPALAPETDRSGAARPAAKESAP